MDYKIPLVTTLITCIGVTLMLCDVISLTVFLAVELIVTKLWIAHLSGIVERLSSKPMYNHFKIYTD